MPEFYAEPMKDRQCCFVCKKTVTGKKVLLTCINCHAITYCGRECQSADWGRHEWNCVPVMVTEFPGKGRGLVAARDIEKGELIFKDKPVIKLAVYAEGEGVEGVDQELMTSLKDQIESLPTEARSQYYKLTTRDGNTINTNTQGSRSDNEVIKLFMSNCKVYNAPHHSVLHLNIALVNHSCAPNAVEGELKQKSDEDICNELRAIRKICKGEEITICYFMDVKKFGSIPRKRKSVLKKSLGFDCKCIACLGQVLGQEKTLKKLIELHNKLNPTALDWKREAGLRSRVVDLTMELHIGQPLEKTSALEALMGIAHLARDKDLVKKAMDMMKQLAEEYKLEVIQRSLEGWQVCLAQWSRGFSLHNAPKKEEIDFILKAIQDDHSSLYA